MSCQIISIGPEKAKAWRYQNSEQRRHPITKRIVEGVKKIVMVMVGFAMFRSRSL